MSNGKVLLVEDNEDDIELIRIAFENAGLANELAVAQDGQTALDMLLDPNHSLPCLVLLDLKLPRVSGLDVLRRLRAEERTRHLPVVVLTVSQEDRDLLDGYNLGANAYVRKPVDPDEFLKAVRDVGLFWMLLNEPPPRKGGQ